MDNKYANDFFDYLIWPLGQKNTLYLANVWPLKSRNSQNIAEHVAP
jgi:hypothetical protein